MFFFKNNDIDLSHKLDHASSPNDEYYKHMHSYVELIYFVSGDVNYNIEGYSKKLHPGDFVFIAPGRFHFADVNRNVFYERYVLKFSEHEIPNSIKTILYDRYPFYRLTHDEISIFRELDKYFSVLSLEDMYLMSKSLIGQLLVSIKNLEPDLNGSNVSVVSSIIHYIESHLEDGLSLSDMSHDLSYSESYISNSFKKEMHIPIMKFIRSKKIIYAHTLISNGEKPQDVATRLNFNDYSTFYRQYLKVIGLPPSRDK